MVTNCTVLVGKMEVDHMGSAVKDDKNQPLQVDMAPPPFQRVLLAIILSITGWTGSITLYGFSMSVFVHWHVTSHGTCSLAHRNCGYKKWFYNNLANYIWLLNCPAVLIFFFFFCQKKYIENNTTYNQIHFQVIIFWLHRGEDKCSILFRDTNSDRPSPKSSPSISHFKTELLKNGWVEASWGWSLSQGSYNNIISKD